MARVEGIDNLYVRKGVGGHVFNVDFQTFADLKVHLVYWKYLAKGCAVNRAFISALWSLCVNQWPNE